MLSLGVVVSVVGVVVWFLEFCSLCSLLVVGWLWLCFAVGFDLY